MLLTDNAPQRLQRVNIIYYLMSGLLFIIYIVLINVMDEERPIITKGVLIMTFNIIEEFLHSAQMMSQITPLEVDILFVLCDLLHQTG